VIFGPQVPIGGDTGKGVYMSAVAQRAGGDDLDGRPDPSDPRAPCLRVSALTRGAVVVADAAAPAGDPRR
jgi:hypothetical protein